MYDLLSLRLGFAKLVLSWWDSRCGLAVLFLSHGSSVIIFFTLLFLNFSHSKIRNDSINSIYCKGLLEALNKILYEPNNVTYGANARAVVQEYSKEAFAKKIEKIYQEQRYLEKTYEW